MTAEVVAARDYPDWFCVDRGWLPWLGQVPGLRFLKDGTVLAHRTHLPVIRKHFGAVKVAGNGAPSDEALAAARAQFDARTEPLGFTLRGYQHEGREFIRGRRGTLLADQMRLGKTPCAICSHEESEGSLVVIAPLSTRHVWEGWLRRRWPDVDPLLITGRSFDRDAVLNRPVIFGHYDILPAWQSLAPRIEPATLIFDEAHVLSNFKSLRTQAAILCSSYAKRVVCLTGTPLWNRPKGLHPILQCVNGVGWDKRVPFLTRYCGGRPGRHGLVAEGTSHAGEFASRLSETMLCRQWSDVADDLPETQRRTVLAPISARDAYEIDLLAEAVRGTSTARVPIGELARYRRLVGDYKAEAARKAAEEVLGAGEPVVIWTWHRNVAQGIADKLGYWHRVVTGAVPGVLRDEWIRKWQEQKVGALILTMAVGQVGIDLSHARKAIFAELDFTPATVAQAEMRTFSPARAMEVVYVVVDHEVDRQLAATMAEKCKVGRILGTPAAEAAVDMIGDAFALSDPGDMDRLMRAVLGGE